MGANLVCCARCSARFTHVLGPLSEEELKSMLASRRKVPEWRSVVEDHPN